MDKLTYIGDKDGILQRMRATDIIVSDFDGTDVKSPLKIATMQYLMNPKNILEHPKLLLWAASAVPKRLLFGKDAESVLWSNLSTILGEDVKGIVNQVKQTLYQNESPENVAERYFFPGVIDFYKEFPNAQKQYISRNFDDILTVFADVAGVDIVNATENKAHELEKIIKSSNNSRYIIRGDSHTDSEVADVADFYKQKGVIDDYIAIAVGKSSHSRYKHVDVVTPSDQRKLVADLQNLV